MRMLRSRMLLRFAAAEAEQTLNAVQADVELGILRISNQNESEIMRAEVISLSEIELLKLKLNLPR
ncbi:MAG: hypothetical protein M3M85_03745 [bacterium]|nr:hypothetical protein [bacterium]